MKTQNKTKHPLFSRYKLIKYHCENPNSSRYHQFGGRGIKLKAAWSRDFWSFAEWVENNIGLPTSYLDVLERIDNDGDYKPSNLQWSTQKFSQNNRTDNTLIKIGRKTQTLTEWCEQQGIWLSTAVRRIKQMNLEPVYALCIKPHPRVKSRKFASKVR